MWLLARQIKSAYLLSTVRAVLVACGVSIAMYVVITIVDDRHMLESRPSLA